MCIFPSRQIQNITVVYVVCALLQCLPFKISPGNLNEVPTTRFIYAYGLSGMHKIFVRMNDDDDDDDAVHLCTRLPRDIRRILVYFFPFCCLLAALLCFILQNVAEYMCEESTGPRTLATTTTAK